MNITPIAVGRFFGINTENKVKEKSEPKSFETTKTELMNAEFAEVPESDDRWQKILFNPDSDGTSRLTERQCRELSEKYNVTDMTMQEKHMLFGELTVMGAISYHDMVTAIERDTGTDDFFDGNADEVGDGVFSASVRYDYPDNIPQNWVERHRELSSEEWQDFAISRQNGQLTNGIGGEFDAKIAGILVQLV